MTLLCHLLLITSLPYPLLYLSVRLFLLLLMLLPCWCFSLFCFPSLFTFSLFPTASPITKQFFILNNYWLYPYYIKSYRLILRHILTTHFLFCLFHFISFARSDLVFSASFVEFHFSLSPLFPMITNSSCCVFAWFSLVPLVCLQLPAPPPPPQLIRPIQPRPVTFTLPLFSFQLISAFQRQSRQFRHSISVSLPLLFN